VVGRPAALIEPTRKALAKRAKGLGNGPLRDPIRQAHASTGRTRCRRAAAEREQLAPFQLVEWHSLSSMPITLRVHLAVKVAA
jgi:hypothetical protein